MSKVIVKSRKIGNLAFESDIDNHKIITDVSDENGGNDLGPRPKKLLLASLIGCTGIDVVMMLNKMKVQFEDFELEASADSTEDHPKTYENIHLIYRFKGKDLPIKNIEKAISLSQEKYCGASAMLKKATPITYEIEIEE